MPTSRYAVTGATGSAFSSWTNTGRPWAKRKRSEAERIGRHDSEAKAKLVADLELNVDRI